MLTDEENKKISHFLLTSILSEEEVNLQSEKTKQYKQTGLELKSMGEEDLIRVHHIPLT